MATLTNEERETHINMVADDRSVWEVYSDDPVMMARLDKIGVAYKTTAVGKWYRLNAKQVSLRKMPTAEQRAARAANLRK